MESNFILPENKPPEMMGFLFIYLNTLILLRRKGYLLSAPNQTMQLPDSYYIRCKELGEVFIVAMYNRLLKIPYLSSSVILWRSFLYFEFYCGSYNRAKHVFYNAINKCPYSKVLWTDAIRVLRPLMKDEEIVNILGYCQSKDIILNNRLDK